MGRYGPDDGAVGVQDGPAGEVFFLVFVEFVGGIDGGTGEFVGIGQVAHAGQADEGAGGSPRGERFKIEGNRKPIEFDEHRFPGVDVLGRDTDETHQKFAAWKAGQDEKIAAKKAGLKNDAIAKAKEAKAAEAKVNEARAEAIAKKKAEAEEAARKAAEEAAAEAAEAVETPAE